MARDLMALAAAERSDLADLLETLTPAQWDAPTLCTEWSVRDVVAHLISYDELSRGDLVRLFGRSLARRILPSHVLVERSRGRTPEDLVAAVRRHAVPRGLTAGFGGGIALTDGTIHHQDIRRPLGLPREIPPERLRIVLGRALWAPVLPTWRNIRGLRLVATDLDWSSGKGAEVRGPGEALLMAVTGRPVALPELSGPGLATLAARIT